jgi:hypothetical protein
VNKYNLKDQVAVKWGNLGTLVVGEITEIRLSKDEFSTYFVVSNTMKQGYRFNEDDIIGKVMNKYNLKDQVVVKWNELGLLVVGHVTEIRTNREEGISYLVVNERMSEGWRFNEDEIIGKVIV